MYTNSNLQYSSLESQKLTTRLLDRKQAAVKKLETARLDHQSRVISLQEIQQLNVRKAQAIEANLDKVEEAMAAINNLLCKGMDWVNIGKLVEQERRKGNSVAELIGGLKLKENIITLKLGEEDYGAQVDKESGEDEPNENSDSDMDSMDLNTNEQKFLNVDVDISKSAWANAREYYDQKKSAAVKEEKTIQSSAKALKSTEKKVLADLKKNLQKEKQLLRPVRQYLWFEKFFFFFSSDGYLVLGYAQFVLTLVNNSLLLPRN
jgi:predicted ribosome quality control (RQC) complex YloA/Tae2 family protein